MSVTFPLDHIHLKSLGGSRTLDNLALACPWCNGFKGDSVSDRDEVSGRKTRLFNPRIDVWKDHFRWSRNRLRILAKSDIGRATIHRLQMNVRDAQLCRSFLITLNVHPAQDPDW